MTDEVRCPGCQGTWYVDPWSAGGEMICPGCLTRIPLKRPERPQASAPPVAAPKPAPRSMPRTASASASPPAVKAATPTAAPPGPGAQQEIVCPRCKLHFAPERHKKSVECTSKKTVLVVEDQEYFREIACDALSPMFDVKSASNSDEARTALSNGGIDLIVLDLTLDGCEAGMDLLRELAPKPCPVLIFTAQDESELYGNRWEELQHAGADDLVLKGMQVSESLVRKAGQLLGTPLDEEDALR